MNYSLLRLVYKRDLRTSTKQRRENPLDNKEICIKIQLINTTAQDRVKNIMVELGLSLNVLSFKPA